MACSFVDRRFNGGGVIPWTGAEHRGAGVQRAEGMGRAVGLGRRCVQIVSDGRLIDAESLVLKQIRALLGDEYLPQMVRTAHASA